MKGEPGVPDTNADKLRSPTQISSRELFDGKREVIIAHGEERYRLCITASNKLILIK
ncbi:MAG: hemin uptake protein HemP [Parvibaculum sp.]|nr:hemin uptake protein HemP [Parvibaculum sp.]